MDEKKGSGRTANVKRNIFYGGMQLVVSRILPFIVRTILIYRFGVEYLGLNSLFTSILNVLSLMELGFGTAVVYSMYKPVADRDIKQICAYLTYYRKIYRFVGITILVAGVILMPFLSGLIKDPELPGGLSLNVCYLIFLSNTVISYLLFGYMTAIPTAFQRRDVLSRVDMGTSILSCVVKSLLLLLTTNFYLYLLAMPGVTIIRNLLTAAAVKRRYPGIECRGEISQEQKKELKKKVAGILVNKMTNVSRNSIDSVCTSAFIGLAMTGIYNNYYFVMSTVLSFSVMICNSMMASVGNSIATESEGKNYSDMRLFDFIYMAIAGWSTTCMFCLYQPFVQTWIGEKMMLNQTFVAVICLYFYILVTGAIRWVYHEGAGLWWECRYIMIGETVANVTLNIVLCKLMGVIGIVLATVLSVFVTNCILCPELIFRLYFKNGKLKEYWMDHVFYTGTMVLTAGVSWFVCEIVLPSAIVDICMAGSILCLGGRLVICCIVSIGMFWVLWHRSWRYQKMLRWIKRLKRA
jgi:O-antigen/teichoic acid export membrane protein